MSRFLLDRWLKIQLWGGFENTLQRDEIGINKKTPLDGKYFKTTRNDIDIFLATAKML